MKNFVLLSVLTLISFYVLSYGEIFVVPGDFANLQVAVDSVGSGDTIDLRMDYSDYTPLEISKSIAIIGNRTVVDSINISAIHTVSTGLTLYFEGFEVGDVWGGGDLSNSCFFIDSCNVNMKAVSILPVGFTKSITDSTLFSNASLVVDRSTFCFDSCYFFAGEWDCTSLTYIGNSIGTCTNCFFGGIADYVVFGFDDAYGGPSIWAYNSQVEFQYCHLEGGSAISTYFRAYPAPAVFADSSALEFTYSGIYGGRGRGYGDSISFYECSFDIRNYTIVTVDSTDTFSCVWDDSTSYFRYVHISETVVQQPNQYSLLAYPNPFNSTCIIETPSGVSVEIFDLLGNKVVEKQIIRNGSFTWQPDEFVGSGVYLVIATKGKRSMSSKLLYIK